MTNSSFSPEFFANNRAQLRASLGADALIVLTANGALQRNADTTYPFRQDSNFWYLTGLDEPDLVLVINSSEEYLIAPKKTSHQVVFDGALNKVQLSSISGIAQLKDAKAGWQQLGGLLKRNKKVATLLSAPAYIERSGFYTNPARSRLIEQMRGALKSLDLVDIRLELARLRMVKQPAELAAIEQAALLSAKALSQIKSALPKFEFEYQVAAELDRAFGRAGYSHAYQPIVAGGQNACTLHYIANSSKLTADSLLLIDAGAEVSHYAADLTRTYSLSRPTPRQTAIHQTVCEIADYALGLLKPGMLLKDYEKRVERYVGQQLKKLNLIKTINKANIRHYYPHATSHFLGLDVHDSADYKQPLQAGMVLTVEPGIYNRAEGIGVRVEDDVVITKNGLNVLSQSLSRSL